MQKLKLISILIVVVLANFTIIAQPDVKPKDSLQTVIIPDFSLLDQDIEQQRIADSIQKEELKAKLNSLNPTDNAQIEELQRRLKEIEDKENKILEEKKQEIEFLKNSAIGYPVVGIMGDTLFRIYSKRGELSAKERAEILTKKNKGVI